MNLTIGQVIWTDTVIYADRIPSNKPRPYLIVKTADSFVYVLAISSVAGKSESVTSGVRSKILLVYNPPLKKPSFAKMDHLIKVSESVASSWKLPDPRPLCANELNRVIKHMDDHGFWVSYS